MPPSDWWWPMFWVPMFPILFLVLCVVVFFFVIVPIMKHGGAWGPWRDRVDDAPKTALNILNERFARGEIDKGEYEEKRRLIS
jgi:putative membrane protein